MRIKERLEKSNIRNIKIRRHHTKEIKKYISNEQKKINNMICPKCNGKLVERSGKYGKFIGCSNYPKCKYTTQINWRWKQKSICGLNAHICSLTLIKGSYNLRLQLPLKHRLNFRNEVLYKLCCHSHSGWHWTFFKMNKRSIRDIKTSTTF